MNRRSMAERLVEAVKQDAEKPPLERWNALVARGAIDAKGRVLLKAPRPMNAACSTPPKAKKHK